MVGPTKPCTMQALRVIPPRLARLHVQVLFSLSNVDTYVFHSVIGLELASFIMSLKSNFEHVRGRVKNVLEESEHLEDESVAQVLDDILLKQNFWAEDVGLENDPYISISKVPSDAIETVRHLTAMKSLLSEIVLALSRSLEE